jgi:hypothetical protein
VSNWIDSGGDMPPLCTDGHDQADCSLEDSQRHRARRWKPPLPIGFALLLALASHPGHARDHGQFGNTNPELKAWFESLKSSKGPCCADSDGAAVSDVDWESHAGHYRVRLDGEWVDVPDAAVISEPNRIGRTMVWPIRDGVGGLYIRCFMPGSMT